MLLINSVSQVSTFFIIYSYTLGRLAQNRKGEKSTEHQINWMYSALEIVLFD